MTDQNLSPEPNPGDDNPLTADGRPDLDDQGGADDQPRTAPKQIRPAAGMAVNTAAATVARLRDPRLTGMTGIAGASAASVALANYVSPMSETIKRIQESVLPATSVAGILASQAAVSGVGRWAEEISGQAGRSMLAGVLGGLPERQSPLTAAVQQLQQMSVPGAGMLASQAVLSGVGRWADEISGQGSRSMLAGALGGLPERQSPVSEAVKRIQESVLPATSAAGILANQAAMSGVGRWAEEISGQAGRSMLAGVLGGLPERQSPLTAAVQQLQQMSVPGAGMLASQAVLSGVGRWADEISGRGSRSMLAGVLGAFQDQRLPVAGVSHWLKDVVRPIDFSWAGFLPDVRNSLRWAVPDGDLLEVARRFAERARELGKRLYFALLAARDAAVRGDKNAVAAFFDEWARLPRSKPSARMQAAMDALIAAPVDDIDPDVAFEMLEDIRRDASRRFNRARRPLTETRINGQEIQALDADPRKLTDVLSIRGSGASVEERILVRLDDRVGNQLDDQRLAMVLNGMTQVEQRVIWAYGLFGETWEGAAVRLGLPPAAGERIRAKAQRRAEAMVRKQRSARPILLGR